MTAKKSEETADALTTETIGTGITHPSLDQGSHEALRGDVNRIDLNDPVRTGAELAAGLELEVAPDPAADGDANAADA